MFLRLNRNKNSESVKTTLQYKPVTKAYYFSYVTDNMSML